MSSSIVYCANREKNVELEDTDFIYESLIEPKHFDILWQGWVILFTDGLHGNGQHPLSITTVAGTCDASVDVKLDKQGDSDTVHHFVDDDSRVDGGFGMGIIDEDTQLPDHAKERILVVTNFRIIAIKNGKLGRAIRQNIHILDLEALTSKHKGILHMRFKGDRHVCVHHHRVSELARAILWTWKSLSQGFPRDLQPKLMIPHAYIRGLQFTAPDKMDGMLATYMAMSDYFNIAQRIHVLDYLMSRFLRQETVFEVYDCFQCELTPASVSDLTALAIAIKYSKYFTELYSVDYPLRDDGLSVFVLAMSPCVERLSLVNTKATKVGFRRLKEVLPRTAHGLTELDISHNALGDSTAVDILQALVPSRKPLTALYMSDCDMKHKAFRALQKLLCTHENTTMDVISDTPSINTWMRDLKILNVSHNRAGRQGTQALCQWITFPCSKLQHSTSNNKNMQQTKPVFNSKVANNYVRPATPLPVSNPFSIGLTELYVMHCELDLTTFFHALEKNEDFSLYTLRVLDVSGNRLVQPATEPLRRILLSTNSLKAIYLCRTGMNHSQCIGIFASVLNNQNTIKFKLDFSDNSFGSKFGKDMLMLWKRLNPSASVHGSVSVPFGNIHTLVLNGTGIGNEGVECVCKCLQGTSIVSLSLERLIKVGIFARPAVALVGKAIATLIQTTPCLQELSLAGDDSFYMKEGLMPVFHVLSTNTTLKHLDVFCNRISNVAILSKLCSVIRQNTSLTSLNVDSNDFAMNDLYMLQKAIVYNSVITNFTIPLHDIKRIMKKEIVPELRSIVAAFSIRMNKNRLLTKQEKNVHDKEEDFDVNNIERDNNGIVKASMSARNSQLSQLSNQPLLFQQLQEIGKQPSMRPFHGVKEDEEDDEDTDDDDERNYNENYDEEEDSRPNVSSVPRQSIHDLMQVNIIPNSPVNTVKKKTETVGSLDDFDNLMDDLDIDINAAVVKTRSATVTKRDKRLMSERAGFEVDQTMFLGIEEEQEQLVKRASVFLVPVNKKQNNYVDHDNENGDDYDNKEIRDAADDFSIRVNDEADDDDLDGISQDEDYTDMVVGRLDTGEDAEERTASEVKNPVDDFDNSLQMDFSQAHEEDTVYAIRESFARIRNSVLYQSAAAAADDDAKENDPDVNICGRLSGGGRAMSLIARSAARSVSLLRVADTVIAPVQSETRSKKQSIYELTQIGKNDADDSSDVDSENSSVMDVNDFLDGNVEGDEPLQSPENDNEGEDDYIAHDHKKELDNNDHGRYVRQSILQRRNAPFQLGEVDNVIDVSDDDEKHDEDDDPDSPDDDDNDVNNENLLSPNADRVMQQSISRNFAINDEEIVAMAQFDLLVRQFDDDVE